jgi:hypothetical protein
MLNDSSQYWKSTFDSMKLCNCDRSNIIEEEKEDDVVVNKIDYNTDYPINKNEGIIY